MRKNRLFLLLMPLVLAFCAPAYSEEDDMISVAPVQKQESSQAIEQAPVSAAPAATAAPAVKAAAPAKSKIESIKVTENDKIVKITISMDKKTDYKASELKSPDRLLIKLSDTGSKSDSINVGKAPVSKVRTAPHDKETWVVIDMDSQGKWVTAAEGNKISIEVEKNSKAKTTQAPVQNDKKVAGILYRVVDVSAKESENKTRVIITADAPVKYRVKKDAAAKLITVSVMDAVSTWGKTQADGTGNVSAVTVSENNAAKVVDIKIKMSQDAPYSVNRDQNQVIVDVDSAVTKKASDRKLDLKQKISLNLQDASLNGVLRLLSTQTGFEFVAGQSVGSFSTTIRVEEKPLDMVLRDILSPNQLFYEVSGNMIRIGTRDELRNEKKYLPQQTKFYYPKSMTSVELKDLLTVQVTKDELLNVDTKVDTANGEDRLMIVGTSGDISKVLSYISDIDRGGSTENEDSGETEDLGRGVKTMVYKFKNIRLMQWVGAEAELEQQATSSILETLKGLLSEKGKLTTDSRTSSVIITDNVKNLKKIEKVLKKLDVKVPQVMIEAKLYEVNQVALKGLGVNWSAESQNKEPAIKADIPYISAQTSGTLNIGMIQSGIKINATLDMLERKNEARLLSSPKIAVLSDNMARIKTTRKTYYAQQTIITNPNSAPVVTTEYKEISLPIELVVFPKVVKGEEIDIHLTLAVNKILTSSSTASGPPDTSEQSAETYIKSANGETLVIGGLISERLSVSEDKVPLLSDIPLLGELFKRKNENKDTVELVVFLTPSIIED